MRFLVLAIACLIPWVFVPPYADAQSFAQALRYEGTLTQISCQELTFVLKTVGEPVRFTVGKYTQVLVEGQRLRDFCGLQRFEGASAVVWGETVGTLNIAGLIQILIFPAAGVTPGLASTDSLGDSGGGGRGKPGWGYGDRNHRHEAPPGRSAGK